MGKIEIKTIGRTGYEAKAFFEDNNVTVLKGSKLSNKFSGNLSNKIAKLREQKVLVSEDNILLQDISFKSASTAAAFVTGNISNGLRVWKLLNGDDLGNHVAGKTTKKKAR